MFCSGLDLYVCMLPTSVSCKHFLVECSYSERDSDNLIVHAFCSRFNAFLTLPHCASSSLSLHTQCQLPEKSQICFPRIQRIAYLLHRRDICSWAGWGGCSDLPYFAIVECGKGTQTCFVAPCSPHSEVLQKGMTLFVSPILNFLPS